jgi:hypothetical protein
MQTLFEDEPAPVSYGRSHHDPFWPPVDAAHVREALGLGPAISDLRLEVALHSAIIRLERQLAGARYLWRREGYTVLEEVPAAMGQGASVVVRQYHDALLGILQQLLAQQLRVMEE